MYKNSKLTIILPIIIAAAIAIGILLGGVVFKSPLNSGQSSKATIPGSEKINLLLSLINKRYVDTVNIDSITENVIPIFLEELDPHSMYFPAKDLAKANESLDGKFEGIGISFNMATDTIVVNSIITGGPSAKAGIMGGDRIIKVNDIIVAGVKMDQDSVVKHLRGPKGSTVNLGIQRVGVKELVPITVTRDVIPIKSILSSYMVEPNVGYIMFSQFSRQTYVELMSAIKYLQAQGMEKLILDLRGNSGGYLDQAIMISNEFLPKDRLIVYTQDRNGNQSKQYSDGNGMFQDLNMVMLIDEYSASSSEIVAGALQDNDRCTIVGRRSFGKGLVQEQIPFSDGSAVRLTIARYYTPSGRSIQKPYDKGIEDYYSDLMNRRKHNELFSSDSIHFADSLKFKTLAGRTVYGGGGIMPDIFVPADTTQYTQYLKDITGKNILYKFTIEYSDKHRSELNKITTIAELDRFFAKDPALVDQFIAYATKAGIAPNANEIQQSRSLITAQLKAYIGRNTPLEENAFSHSILPIDNAAKKAVEILKADK